ncbi:unnamed protein product [Rhizoctonia solani]|uniref:Uncharacterized protein n=1 Tax=Rhizoctonia solani TaxID=456999 RepID=A0A8H3CT10_9AGAM|nr:unnamed protein product [Rhizoctonia solani]CAE6494129.1 unnamed protein product [Rhizoctonia solani]
MPPTRTSPTKDSRAARAARRDRVVLAEIELWRSVAGQTATPSRRSSSGSTTDGSFVDENGSIAGTEEDLDEEARSVASASTSARRRRALRPVQQTTSTRTLRPLPSRSLSFAGSDTPPAVSPEIRSLELEVSHLQLVEAPPRPPPPSTPRRRSTRLRL